MGVCRRDVLIAGVAGAAGLLGGARALAAVVPARKLAFQHLHTGEKLDVVYAENGAPIDDALRAINHLLRDFRTGEIHAIDVGLLDILSAVHERFDFRGRFEIISGFRSPKTNEALRAGGSGVAKDSLHVYGRAIDVRLTGIDTAAVRRAAIELKRGGVGYYQKSNFVHLDTGRTRIW